MHRKDNGRPPRRLAEQILGRVNHRGAAARPGSNGIVTLEGKPGSAVLGAGIADRVEHLEGVIAVRDRFVYPARSAPSFPSDPGL
jgi:hypothetical protein